MTRHLQRIFPVIWLVAGLGCSESSRPTPVALSNPSPTSTPTPADKPQAKVSRIRLVPFTSESMTNAQMVLVDWENTGTVPIYEVYARIDLYDSANQLMEFSSSKSQCIFAAAREDQKIEPGKEYKQKDGEGFVVIEMPGSSARAKRVSVEIVRLESELASIYK